MITLNQLPYKVLKRYRRFSEIAFPRIAFAYAKPDADLRGILQKWSILQPYERIPQLLSNLSDIETLEVLKAADAILENHYFIFGTRFAFPDSYIRWNVDPSVGFEWPDILHSLIPHSSREGEDIKAPWELSRFHQGVSLALAYRISQKSNYLNKFVELCLDWIQKNRVGYGVNWASPMDVAIRSVNWLAAISIFGDSLLQQSPEAVNRIVSSLWEHGCFLRTHLEWLGPNADVGANHLLFNLAGLTGIGAFFHNTRRGKSWFRFAKHNLEKQILRQFTESGVHFEYSLYYHRFCLEGVLWAQGIALLVASEFSAPSIARTGKAIKFISCYMASFKAAPLIGDEDGGRFIKTPLDTYEDHSYLCSENRNRNSSLIRELLFISDNGVATHRNSPVSLDGFHFLRSDTASVVFRAGELAFKGTHAHNDQLSFVLSANDTDFLVDRGTYSYGSNIQMRNKFRSTTSHNVVQIDHQEQNPLGDVFMGISDATKTIVTNTTDTSIEAAHFGYCDPAGGTVKCIRRLELLDHLLVQDRIIPARSCIVLAWFFHFHPEITLELLSSRLLAKHQNGTQLSIQFCFEGITNLCTHPHSPSYGIVMKAPLAIFTHTVSKSSPDVYRFLVTWE